MMALGLGLGLPLTLTTGVADAIVVNGVTYTRIRFGGQPLDTQISSQPLYGRAA